jgi:hypothetical protein
MSAEQDAVIWQLCHDLYNAYFDSGTLTFRQVLGLGFTWEKGRTDFLGWGGVQDELGPSLRGPMAYMFGHLFLRRHHNVQEAGNFFRTALKDAPAGSPLTRLARAELDRLQKK